MGECRVTYDIEKMLGERACDQGSLGQYGCRSIFRRCSLDGGSYAVPDVAYDSGASPGCEEILWKNCGILLFFFFFDGCAFWNADTYSKCLCLK